MGRPRCYLASSALAPCRIARSRQHRCTNDDWAITSTALASSDNTGCRVARTAASQPLAAMSAASTVAPSDSAKPWSDSASTAAGPAARPPSRPRSSTGQRRFPASGRGCVAARNKAKGTSETVASRACSPPSPERRNRRPNTTPRRTASGPPDPPTRGPGWRRRREERARSASPGTRPARRRP